jgi:hypothetical protein
MKASVISPEGEKIKINISPSGEDKRLLPGWETKGEQ